MRERTPAEKLIEELAFGAATSVLYRSVIPSAPGALVQHLGPEKRAILQGLTSDDVAAPRVNEICHPDMVAMAREWYRKATKFRRW